MIIAPVESSPLTLTGGVKSTQPAFEPEGTTGPDAFGSVLGSAVQEANRADFAANQKVEALASGAIDDIHGTMISTKEADIALKLVGSVRTKILDAFQELWRTSV